MMESSGEMFHIWLKLEKSAKGEHELALELVDTFQDYPKEAAILLFPEGNIFFGRKTALTCHVHRFQ